jgi:hypothetical protein
MESLSGDGNMKDGLKSFESPWHWQRLVTSFWWVRVILQAGLVRLYGNIVGLGSLRCSPQAIRLNEKGVIL